MPAAQTESESQEWLPSEIHIMQGDRLRRARCSSRSFEVLTVPLQCGARDDDRVVMLYSHRDILAFSDEHQSILIIGPVDADKVAKMHLLSGQQVGKRVDYMPLDSALQVPRAITLIRPMLNQKLPTRVRYTEEELHFGCFQNSMLQLGELDLQDFFKLFPFQRMKYDYFVEAVHELRRELTPCGFDGRPLDFLIEVLDRIVSQLDETVPTRHEFRDFIATQIGCQEDDGLGKVHPAIVTESQRRLIQHAKEQLPQRIGSLLDFVEEQEGKL